ncbi:MAG: alanine racemase [Clostridia bacterium]
MLRQNLVTIDLNAIAHNYAILKGAVPTTVRVMPVIKADAYGHGMLPVAKTLCKCGATDFAVALPEEGIALREGGIQATVLVLGAATERAVSAAIQNDLTQTVFTPEMVHLMNEEAMKQGKTAYVHIKLDTGMNRIGLKTEQEADALARALSAAPNVVATGIYTHFADADNPLQDGNMNAFTRMQLERFIKLRAHFDHQIPAHVANSAMSLLAPEAYFNMIREGISLYGYPPVDTHLSFLPALRWTTEVVHVKTVLAGESIGYGCAFIATHEMRVATVAVGYGDGYHRLCANHGQMLVCKKRANILGRVCMDQTMLDVTDIPEVCIGDEVVLLGAQGNETIDAVELASYAQTICYEVLLSITARVPKTYLGE